MPQSCDILHSANTSVFVYGTLKRGQCREGLWPRLPVSVNPAWVFGTLFGRHDYPAMKTGSDQVVGELWRFKPSDLDRVLEVLDQIEGANQPGSIDLYRRVVTEVWVQDQADAFADSFADAFVCGGTASVYFYAGDPLEDGFNKLSNENGYVCWPS